MNSPICRRQNDEMNWNDIYLKWSVVVWVVLSIASVWPVAGQQLSVARAYLGDQNPGSSWESNFVTGCWQVHIQFSSPCYDTFWENFPGFALGFPSFFEAGQPPILCPGDVKLPKSDHKITWIKFSPKICPADHLSIMAVIHGAQHKAPANFCTGCVSPGAAWWDLAKYLLWATWESASNKCYKCSIQLEPINVFLNKSL